MNTFFKNDNRRILMTCVRCSGKMSLLADEYGKYWDCIQCGHTIDVSTKGKFQYKRYTRELSEQPKSQSWVARGTAHKCDKTQFS